MINEAELGHFTVVSIAVSGYFCTSEDNLHVYQSLSQFTDFSGFTFYKKWFYAIYEEQYKKQMHTLVF